jgi:hypothetical protein
LWALRGARFLCWWGGAHLPNLIRRLDFWSEIRRGRADR